MTHSINNISGKDLVQAYQNVSEDMIYPHPASLLPIQDKKLLVAIAKLLKPNSILLDIGTFLGGSATILAHANANIKIISMDSYEYGGWSWDDIALTEYVCGKSKIRNLENVTSSNFNNFKNILFLEGKSPYSFKKQEKNPFEVDVYIEDSTHNEPNFSDNLSYWNPKIKKNGLLVLHDYRPYLDNEKAMEVQKRCGSYLLFDNIINIGNNLKQNENWEYLMDTTCELGHNSVQGQQHDLLGCPSYIVFKKLN